MDNKQKAKELIETFTFNCRECDNAKLSALFAVDEILNLDSGDSLNKNYWEEVRQELLAT